MPNKWTFEMPVVKRLIQKYNVGLNWIDPFCGQSNVAEYRNDLAVDKIDAFDFLSKFNTSTLTGCLFDPPYSMEQTKRSYQSIGIADWQTRYGNNKNGGFPNVKDQIARILYPNGYCISFGWNSNGLGKKRGFEIIEVVLIAHGGNHNDTIVTVEQKSTNLTD